MILACFGCQLPKVSYCCVLQWKTLSYCQIQLPCRSISVYVEERRYHFVLCLSQGSPNYGSQAISGPCCHFVQPVAFSPCVGSRAGGWTYVHACVGWPGGACGQASVRVDGGRWCVCAGRFLGICACVWGAWAGVCMHACVRAGTGGRGMWASV